MAKPTYDENVAAMRDGLERIGEQIDVLLTERAELLAALRDLVDTAITDADACAICLQDAARHASSCPVPAAAAAIAHAEGR